MQTETRGGIEDPMETACVQQGNPGSGGGDERAGEPRSLHRKEYFSQRMESLEEVPASVIDLLHLSRSLMETFNQLQKRLLRALAAPRPTPRAGGAA